MRPRAVLPNCGVHGFWRSEELRVVGVDDAGEGVEGPDGGVEGGLCWSMGRRGRRILGCRGPRWADCDGDD